MFALHELTPGRIDGLLELLHGMPGIGLSAADEPVPLARYLRRNSGLSVAASAGQTLVGAVLCGHDGRRGYLHHVAVHPAYRRVGLGRHMIDRCLGRLSQVGIDKVHLFVKIDNETGQAFWAGTGWELRQDLLVYSRQIKTG